MCKPEDLIPNDLLAGLIKNHAENAITYQGYIAESGKGDTILLYNNILDLTESCEIKICDILYCTEAPKSCLPFGGVILWLKKNSEINFRRTENLEAPDFIDNGTSSNEETIEITAGRIFITIPEGSSRSKLIPTRPPCHTKTKWHKHQ